MEVVEERILKYHFQFFTLAQWFWFSTMLQWEVHYCSPSGIILNFAGYQGCQGKACWHYLISRVSTSESHLLASDRKKKIMMQKLFEKPRELITWHFSVIKLFEYEPYFETQTIIIAIKTTSSQSNELQWKTSCGASKKYITSFSSIHNTSTALYEWKLSERLLVVYSHCTALYKLNKYFSELFHIRIQSWGILLTVFN